MDEGWEPDLEEFLSRVPDAQQEGVFEAIERAIGKRPPVPAKAKGPKDLNDAGEPAAPAQAPAAPRIQTTAAAFAQFTVEPEAEELSDGIQEIREVEEIRATDEIEVRASEDVEALEDVAHDAEPTTGDAHDEACIPQLSGYSLEQNLGRTQWEVSRAAQRTTLCLRCGSDIVEGKPCQVCEVRQDEAAEAHHEVDEEDVVERFCNMCGNVFFGNADCSVCAAGRAPTPKVKLHPPHPETPVRS